MRSPMGSPKRIKGPKRMKGPKCMKGPKRGQ